MNDREQIRAAGKRLAKMPLNDRTQLLRAIHSGVGEAGQTELNTQSVANPAGTQIASFWQEQIWFIAELLPDIANYNAPVVLRLNGRLDMAAINNALNTIVQRHDILRVSLRRENGETLQVVSSIADVDLPFEDLSGSIDTEKALVERAEKLARENIGLQNAPLFRLALFQLNQAGTRHALIWVASHAIFDGWSVGVFTRELCAHYSGKQLPPLAMQYADFTSWQKERISGQREEKLLSFWEETLADAPPLNFPYDKPLPKVPTVAGATHLYSLTLPLSQKLKAISGSIGVTPFVVFMAAYSLLLMRWSGNTDFVVGTATSGRLKPEFEQLIGSFQNVVGIRCVGERDQTFREFTENINGVIFDALDHQELPFHHIVKHLQPVRDRGRNPIWQTFFGFGSLPATDLELQMTPGIHLTCDGIPNRTVKFDFDMTVEERGQRYVGRFDYSTELLEAKTAESVCEEYVQLLSKISQDEDALLATLLGDFERASGPASQATTIHFNVRDDEVKAIARNVANDWQEALSISDIDWNADFFALGGHSIAAADLAAKVRATFDLDFGLRDFLGNCTVAGVAHRINEMRKDTRSSDEIYSYIETLSDEEVEVMIAQRAQSGESDSRPAE